MADPNLVTGTAGTANSTASPAYLLGWSGSQWVPIKVDSAGVVDVDASGGGGDATAANQVTGNASLSVIDDWDETDRAKVNLVVGVAGITAGAGAVAAGTPRVTLASDDPLNAKFGTLGQKTMAGSAPVTLASDQSGIAITGAVTATGSVSLDAAAANGTSFYKSIDLDESEEEIKATAATLYGWHIVNRTTAPIYVKLYNATAANVIVGTTVPDLTLEIPGNATDHVGATVAFAPGIKFSTALTAAATTLIADNDATAPAANACLAMFFFK